MVVPPKASNMCVLSVGEPMVWGSPFLGNLHIYDLEQKGKQSVFYCFATGVQTANFYYWVMPCSCLTQQKCKCVNLCQLFGARQPSPISVNMLLAYLTL